MRLCSLGRVAVRNARFDRNPLHDQLVAVGVVDRGDLLDDSRSALEPHPRVDVLLWQRCQCPVSRQLVLHEHEVPELEEALAARATRETVCGAAADFCAPVEVDLGVRPTRPGAPDRPEVLRRRQRHDPLGRHPDRAPQVDRDLVGAEPELRVARVDAHPDAIPIELQPLLDELGRERDRALLEVLPEREVAQHLEEREVVGVETDDVDVRCPEYLLRRRRQQRGWRLETEEERHLRLHAGAREKCRVVVGPRHE